MFCRKYYKGPHLNTSHSQYDIVHSLGVGQPFIPVGITDTQVTAIGGEKEVRVHLGQGGKRRVVDWSKGAEGTVHEIGDRGGLEHG